VDRESSVNILYGHALDRMEDTSEQAQKLINPWMQSLLYGFDGSEARESTPRGGVNRCTANL